MLAGLDSRQLAEMYAFAELEPLDEPLQKMLAQLTSVLARVHGNEVGRDEFMLRPAPAAPAVSLTAEDEGRQRAQQLVDMFSAASRRNEKVH